MLVLLTLVNCVVHTLCGLCRHDGRVKFRKNMSVTWNIILSHRFRDGSCSVTNIRAWFQAYAAMKMRSALFWDFTQRRMVVPYRRFGTTDRSNLQWSRSPRYLVCNKKDLWTNAIFWYQNRNRNGSVFIVTRSGSGDAGISVLFAVGARHFTLIHIALLRHRACRNS